MGYGQSYRPPKIRRTSKKFGRLGGAHDKKRGSEDSLEEGIEEWAHSEEEGTKCHTQYQKKDWSS